ncbi:MAG: tetratricopeptide repeat protein, partial [Nitrospirota bacterium]|nr:tetratricopeptide repeat protein [Nitrospirota bacterium]
ISINPRGYGVPLRHPFSFWLGRVRMVLLGIPLLIAACGTASHVGLPGQESSSTNQEIVHPQAYYHFLRGSLAELNNEGVKALEAYQAGLAFDPDSIFLKFRIAKLHFSLAQMTAAVDMAQQIPIEHIASGDMFLNVAKIFSGAGEPDQAQQVFAEGERQFPLEARLYLAHGTWLLSEKDYPQAEVVFRDLLQHVGDSAEAHYYLGIIALEKHAKREAVVHFEQAIALNTSFVRAYVKLVELLDEGSESQRAIELIETFLRDVNPHHREFRLRLVRLYVAQKGADQALEHLDYMLDQNPGDLHAQVRKAQIYGEMGNFSAAVEELQSVLRDKPNELRVRDFLGLLYEEMKEYEQAIQVYQANVEIDPTFFESILHLGFVSYRLKRNEDALSYLDQAVKLNPKRPEPYLLLGLTYFQMKKYLQAKIRLEDGIFQDPSNAELHFNLGTAYDKLDRFDEVVREMEQALELDPEHADALNYLGYSYADRGINVEEAVSLTQRAVALKPHNGYYVDSLAWAFYKVGRIEEALEMMQRAVALVSDDPVIYEHLGEIFLLREERENAREAWMHSLQLDSTNDALKQRFRDMGFGEPIPTLSQQSTYTP